MFKNSMKMCLIALLTLGLAFTAACGDDDEKKPTDTSGDVGVQDKDTQGTGGKDADKTDEKDAPSTEPPKAKKTVCEGDNPPARCEEAIADFKPGPASVITKFQIAAKEDKCCFEYRGLGSVDNELGDALTTFQILPTVNESLVESIESGGLTIILEHEGLDKLKDSGEFTVNFYLGEYAGTDLMINSASLDQGTQPLAFLPNGKVDGDGKVTAGRGNVMLSLELFGTTLDLSVREAEISASVNEEKSSIGENGEGVTLIEGKLGGLLIVNEIYDAANEFATTCPCMGLKGDKMIDYSTGPGKCAPAVAKHTCDATKEAETACEAIAKNCSMLTAAGSMAKTNYDGGEENALSLGAIFEAESATITGISTK